MAAFSVNCQILFFYCYTRLSKMGRFYYDQKLYRSFGRGYVRFLGAVQHVQITGLHIWQVC